MGLLYLIKVYHHCNILSNLKFGSIFYGQLFVNFLCRFLIAHHKLIGLIFSLFNNSYGIGKSMKITYF